MRAQPLQSALLLAVFSVVLGCAQPSPVETGPDAELLFLVQRTQPTEVMQALFQGRVNLDQAGCFRLADNEAATVIWPFASTLARDDVSLVVLDADGDTLLRTGELVRLGGGFVQDLPSLDLLESDMVAAALARCPGSYWVISEVLPR